MDPTTGVATLFRRALPEEAGILSNLAFRGIAYWGYDDDTMEQCRQDLTITPKDIEDNTFFIMANQENRLGFYALRRGDADHVELLWLFVEPNWIGQGFGKQLWGHAVQRAKENGYRYMMIKSNPYAERFYLAQGAERLGEVPGAVPGVLLPWLRYHL